MTPMSSQPIFEPHVDARFRRLERELRISRRRQKQTLDAVRSLQTALVTYLTWPKVLAAVLTVLEVAQLVQTHFLLR